MTRLPPRFTEDRALRDAARAVLAEDIERLRASLAEEGIASRVSSGVTGTIFARIRTGARDVLAQAGERKGLVALVIGAVILFLARGPIFTWIEELLGDPSLTDDNPETAAPAAPPPEGDPA